MRPKNIESYHLANFSEYCKNHCVDIVIKQKDVESCSLDYYRGLYAGYLYGRKIANFLKKRKKRILNYELYNHFKNQKNWNSKSRGEKEALYDIMNYISLI